jgi:hypothetical protein
MRVQWVGVVVCLALAGACSSKLTTPDAGTGGASGGGTGTIDSGPGGTGAIDGGPIILDGGPSILTADGGTSTMLAMGAPADIAVDGTYVYWTDPTAKTVMKVPKSGGAAITLASSQDVGPGLAVDTAYVYWTTTQGSVMKAPLVGGAPIAVASDQRQPNSLAISLGNLYWANAGANFVGTGSVMKASLATGEVATLAANRDGVGALAVDATSVYWIENGEGPGSMLRMPLAGGAVESVGIVVQGSWPVLSALAVGSGTIFWSVHVQPNGGNRLMKRALAAAPETTLLVGSHAFAPLLADGLVLYTPEGRTILRISFNVGVVEAIPTEGTPTHLAVAINDAHIYFTTAEGAVMAVAKP